MNFELTQEQQQLQDSLGRLLAARYSFDKRRAVAATELGHDSAAWEEMAQLGIAGLLVPEAQGGFSAGARDCLPIMGSLGAALCLEPVLANMLAVAALKSRASEEVLSEVLPGAASGQTHLAWAHEEPGARSEPCWVETSAVRDGVLWRLHGTKTNVLAASVADNFVVSARVSGAHDDRDGRALFLVASDAPGLSVRPYRLVDDSLAGELKLDGARAAPLSDAPDTSASKAIDFTLAFGMAAACADMAGAAQAAFSLAQQYLNTRKQFGRVLGENQALRHKIAEMLVSVEMARSMAIAAAIAADDLAQESSWLELHRAKHSVGRHARSVALGAIQLHGGIGMTEEYAVGHYLRRIHVLDTLFGDSQTHAQLLADMPGA